MKNSKLFLTLCFDSCVLYSIVLILEHSESFDLTRRPFRQIRPVQGCPCRILRQLCHCVYLDQLLCVTCDVRHWTLIAGYIVYKERDSFGCLVCWLPLILRVIVIGEVSAISASVQTVLLAVVAIVSVFVPAASTTKMKAY